MEQVAEADLNPSPYIVSRGQRAPQHPSFRATIRTGGAHISTHGTLGPFTIFVRASIFSRGWDLEIFKKRSDISILVAFSIGHFRSRGVKNLKNRNIRRTLIVNYPFGYHLLSRIWLGASISKFGAIFGGSCVTVPMCAVRFIQYTEILLFREDFRIRCPDQTMQPMVQSM